MVTESEIARLRADLDARGGRLVFTNGCFDVLHVGHTRYLAEARALGDALVVAVNSDASVRALKGPGRPVNDEEDRAEVLEALAAVDGVVVFGEERATRLIRALRPHVYAKGGDYTVESLNAEESAALEAVGAEIHILPLVPGKSTTSTLAALRKGGEGRTPRIGVLGSGRGSNLDAIFRAIEAGTLEAEIALVVSDVADSGVLEMARARGVPAVFVDPGEGRSRLGEASQKEICDRLRAAGVDLVVLAGFLRVLRAPLLEEFADRIVNIHPSLLPAFKGLRAWEQALNAGVPVTGCTAHMVTEDLDSGVILGRTEVPVLPGDGAESLHARIQEAEHVLYPRCIATLLRSQVRNP